jgi:hypothetical protein
VRLPPRMGLSWSNLVWSILPGLGQIRMGQRSLGWVILSAWIGILLLAAAAIGTSICMVLCLAAVSVHSLAVSLVLSEPLRALTLLRRAIVGITLYVVLLVALYRPAALVGRGVFRVLPVQGVHATATVANGDALLYGGRWMRPSELGRGDLVVFEVPALSGDGVITQGGFGVDRVVGLPGDRVRTDGHSVWVNDAELTGDALPLRGAKNLPPLELSAGPGEYIILPSTLRWQTNGPAGAQVTRRMISDVARVSGPEVLGRVYWRIRPLSRLGPM